MNKPRIYASAGTALIAAIVVLLMMWCSLSAASEPPADKADRGEIVMDDLYFDVMDQVATPSIDGDGQAQANADGMQQAQPTPASGTDMDNSGAPGVPHKNVAADADQPVKSAKPAEKAGPSAEDLKRDEDRRMANNEVTNAFNNSQGSHNTANGAEDNGNAGNPDSPSQQGSYTGRGTGSVAKGWALPAYGAVKSTVTGSVKMKVTFDKHGKVVDLQFVGGDAPAATSKSVRNACAIEVRSRAFTRTASEPAPETSTAYITYNFK